MDYRTRSSWVARLLRLMDFRTRYIHVLQACFVYTLSFSLLFPYANFDWLREYAREQAFNVTQSWPGILKFSQIGSLRVHEARLLWRGNLTRKGSYAVILLVPKDFRLLGFPHMFPTGNKGKCLFIGRWRCHDRSQICLHSFLLLRTSKI